MRMRRDDTQFHSIPPQLKQLLADAAERLPPSRYDCPNPMQLLDFINKNLSKSTRIRIAAHLRCCRKCLRDLDDVLRARAACDNSPPCESTAAHLRVDRRTIIPEFLTAWIREQHGRAVLTIPGKIPLTLWREHGLLHISIPADHVDVRLILDGLEVFPSASVSADNSKTFQFKNSPSPPRSPGRFLAWQAEILQDGALIRLRYKLRISRDSQTANTVQDGFMLVAAATDGERLASAPVLRSFGISRSAIMSRYCSLFAASCSRSGRSTDMMADLILNLNASKAISRPWTLVSPSPWRTIPGWPSIVPTKEWSNSTTSLLTPTALNSSGGKAAAALLRSPGVRPNSHLSAALQKCRCDIVSVGLLRTVGPQNPDMEQCKPA